MKIIVSQFVLAVAIGVFTQPVGAQTLKAVKERGSVICGVNPELLGFSARDEKIGWTGFDIDLCRAIAAAIFNDVSKVTFKPLTNEQRLVALSSGEIDVLSRNTTWTMSRETSLKLNFAAVTYYDGQGFLIRRNLKVESALELDAKSVCTQTGTTSELNLADYFRANKMSYRLSAFATADETGRPTKAVNANVLTSDVSQLYAERLKLANPGEHIILPDIISKEPLGPVVRQGDDQWFKIVQWTHFAMINAEELGVSSKTIEQAMKSEKPDVRRLIGVEGNYGEQIGLTNDWAARIVRLVGNYDEIFERNVGNKIQTRYPPWDQSSLERSAEFSTLRRSDKGKFTFESMWRCWPDTSQAGKQNRLSMAEYYDALTFAVAKFELETDQRVTHSMIARVNWFWNGCGPSIPPFRKPIFKRNCPQLSSQSNESKKTSGGRKIPLRGTDQIQFADPSEHFAQTASEDDAALPRKQSDFSRGFGILVGAVVLLVIAAGGTTYWVRQRESPVQRARPTKRCCR